MVATAVENQFNSAGPVVVRHQGNSFDTVNSGATCIGAMALGTNDRASPCFAGSFKLRLQFHRINPQRFEAVGVGPTSIRPVSPNASKNETVRRLVETSTQRFVGRVAGIIALAVTDDSPEAASSRRYPAEILN
jgi:hypothetical protein